MTAQVSLRPPRKGPLQPESHGVPSWSWKITMAITGIIWTAFAFIHLWGNLKVWTGADSFDSYAHWLREVGYPLVPEGFILWAFRIVLATSLLLHATGGFTLAFRARAARGAVRARPAAKLSRLMAVSGLIILCFLVVHVLDLTMGVQPIAPDTFVAGSAYANLIASLSRVPMALFYGITMLILASHILHGIKVVWTDLGSTTLRWRRLSVLLALVLALVMVLGNGLIPLAVQMGWLA